MSSRLTVNYGLRLEHETGLAEKDDKLIVGFDRDVVSPLNVTIPAGLDPLQPAARQVKGGVIYAGVDGAPRHQGDPPSVKLSPRGGVVFSAEQRHRASRRIWRLLGAVEPRRHSSRGLFADDDADSEQQHSDYDHRQSVSKRIPAAHGEHAWDCFRA